MTAARKSGARYLTGDDVDLQLSAILKWYDSEYRKEGSFDRLGEIRCPVLVAGGTSRVWSMLSWMNLNGRTMTGFDGRSHVGAAWEWLIRKLRHVMCVPSIARAFELIVATRLPNPKNGYYSQSKGQNGRSCSHGLSSV